ncbi:small ribosomal subunit protein mS26-like [Antedon mediterranea]|uniref:small ribosomal subunit protein mS26-like n=1 Tax=Antedon mediterranea TaxID=105859 RepID=UPI003AF7F411
MERIQGSLKRLFDIKAAYEAVNRSAVLVQQVRWRKMRTNPINKSKIGRVKERTPIDPWEYKFLKTSFDHHRTTMKSLRLLFLEDFPNLKLRKKQVGSANTTDIAVDDEHKRLMLWNEEENKKTKALRDARFAEEDKVKEEIILNEMMKAEEEHSKTISELEKIVKMEKEASKNFITLENMTERIEEAIDSKKNYNFLINKTGKIVLPEDTAWTELREQNKERGQELS